ncbi:MAG: putative toxin-antitoxin system toxin component, PIN family [Oscillospiraceae bacterium]|nr:putative toxin-antitoxin system toxin component, PIN family [Oscillospiraceae bacterium]
MICSVVIDTNVIVSSNISSGGKPAEIMKLFYAGKLQMFYSLEIISEYKRVLTYKKLNIGVETQNDIIKALEIGGILIEPPKSNIPLIDETDRTFYDTAKSSKAFLITGNSRHYPDEPFIMTPAEFMRVYKECFI